MNADQNKTKTYRLKPKAEILISMLKEHYNIDCKHANSVLRKFKKKINDVY